MKRIPIKDTMNPASYGPFANPDYPVLAKVAISTWIKAPVVILYGEDEIKSGKPTLRDLSSGEEKSIEIK